MPMMSGGDAVVRLGPRARHLHDLCPARRPERSSVQRHVRRRRRAFGGAYPARTGRRLHGARRRTRDRQTRRLLRGARSRFSQQHRGARHRLFDRRARARAHRPDPEPRHRQRSWPPARNSRPDRHPAQADQMGRTGRHAAARRPTSSRAHSRSCNRAGRGRSAWRCRPTCWRRAPRSRCRRPCPSMAIRRSTRTRSRAPPICWRKRSVR